MASNNATSVSSFDNCTEVSELCPIEATATGSILSLGAAVFFTGCFSLLLLLQVYFGIKARTWSFMIWLGIGTSLEILGHLARVSLSRNPWSVSLYIAQFMTLLLAPTFIAAALSITLKHLVIWYGPQWSVLRPSLYPWVFVGTEFLTIIIQFIGAFALAAGAAGQGNRTLNMLSKVMILGGIAFQVVNMAICSALMMIYVRRRNGTARYGLKLLEPESASGNIPLAPAPMPDSIPMGDGGKASMGMASSRAESSTTETRRARIFVFAVGVAYPAIIIRCAYRILEHIPSIARDVVRNEPLFLALDATMTLLAVAAVTIFHPCIFFPFLGLNTKKLESMPDHGGFQMRATSGRSHPEAAM
ncbi:hypothetical protein NCS52_00142600 [Fusarium sp. LHS14.1]|nr:hypothetical protein NCS52_00142600 [Fusarium sp. LHS14.1]